MGLESEDEDEEVTTDQGAEPQQVRQPGPRHQDSDPDTGGPRTGDTGWHGEEVRVCSSAPKSCIRSKSEGL